MIVREIANELIESAKEYPVVTILGPRQSGKTTLAKMTFPDYHYYSLEDPDILYRVKNDPKGFFNNLIKGAILDEIQNAPELLSYIQGIVDIKNESGQFILTGSHQLNLHEAITQSLAGRTAILSLLPFSLDEISIYKKKYSAFDLIFNGSFPRVYDKKLNIKRFFGNYIQTYIERDVRMMINLKNLTNFQVFLRILAGRVGQLVNYKSLSNNIGVSETTIKQWISILKASFVVFELPPFYENIKKRVIKSSKIYFLDTGLVSYLLGINSGDQVFRDPLRGGLYENMVILDIMKYFFNRGIRPDLFFYRDSNNVEVDLLIKNGNKILPIEIKSSSTFSEKFIDSLLKFKKISGRYDITPGLVICNIDETLEFKEILCLNVLNDRKELFRLLGENG